MKPAVPEAGVPDPADVREFLVSLCIKKSAGRANNALIGLRLSPPAAHSFTSSECSPISFHRSLHDLAESVTWREFVGKSIGRSIDFPSHGKQRFLAVRINMD